MAGVLAGAAWGGIAGVLKARFGVNEILLIKTAFDGIKKQPGHAGHVPVVFVRARSQWLLTAILP
ncbi:MAG: hypothetical protein IAE85_18615 [Anaerolinea sp.]|nr:hypothetical protein [Anaerolinea sp.]